MGRRVQLEQKGRWAWYGEGDGGLDGALVAFKGGGAAV